MAQKVALITGGMGGLGETISTKMAGAGYQVAVTCSPTNRTADEWLARMSGNGYDFKAYPADVGDFESCRRCVEQVVEKVGPVDILVNNAGITLDKPSVEVTDEEWDTVLTTNLASMFRCCRAVAPGMIERGRGKIINIGSMYGKLGVSHYAAYCASKAAADGLTRSLAAEWARHGIQVNCLAPGYMNTDIPRAAMADPKTRERFLSKVPARRLGEPEEAAALAVYLASPASDFMTGQTVYLDGGQTMAW